MAERSKTLKALLANENRPLPKLKFLKMAQKTKPILNATLSVVAVKKAVKTIEGMGKSITALEVFPSGGFALKVGSTLHSATVDEGVNPFDELLK
jgi:hypothetical protein